ncbi:hypothetical protein [Aliidiomarina haloalkalitolerans]|uniref:Uncharacterized protein n=1 Tax=Aliidiomarina haloalkalitolerans TaxID=859059 RepID=A0A432VUN9_9GAMM|nr:hypothetical protein [Aliidiomarina haloalkalitolerans]RUO20192.1 hypothetical protein CWE06_06080 [Aliidiomarina haloalkalitolerans]
MQLSTHVARWQRTTAAVMAIISAALWIYLFQSLANNPNPLSWYEQRTLATGQFAFAVTLFIVQMIVLATLHQSLRSQINSTASRLLLLGLMGVYSINLIAGMMSVAARNNLIPSSIWLVSMIVAVILALILGIYLALNKTSRWLRVSGLCFTLAIATALFFDWLTLVLITAAFITLAVYFLKESARAEII